MVKSTSMQADARDRWLPRLAIASTAGRHPASLQRPLRRSVAPDHLGAAIDRGLAAVRAGQCTVLDVVLTQI